MTNEQRTTLFMVMGATMALDAGNGAVFGLLERIRELKGLETAQLGLISASLFGASLIGLLTLAHFADKGYARVMLLSGLGLSAASLVWFGLADNLWELVAARAGSGIALSLFMAGGRSIVARLAPERAGENLGKLAGAEILGFLIGPVLSVGLYDIGGLSLPFFTFAGVAIVALIYFGIHFPTTAPVTAAPKLNAWKRTGLDLLGDRGVLAAALLALAVFLPVGAYDSMWSVYLSELGASTAFIGISLTLYAIPLALLSGLGGRYVDRVGPMAAVRRSFCVALPVIVAYGLLTNIWIVVFVAVIEAAAQAVAAPAAQSAMSRACPPERTGAGQGLAGAFGLCGGGLLASVAPAVYDRYGADVLFIGVAGLVGAIAVTSMILDRSHRQRLAATAA